VTRHRCSCGALILGLLIAGGAVAGGALAGGAVAGGAVAGGAVAGSVPADAVPDYAPVTPGRVLDFPRDYGSHPEFRTEWWYITGWLSDAHGEPMGFQITFFRAKPSAVLNNPSAFAPRQLVIAHCAISDPKRGHLWQDQRVERAGFGLAGALTSDTDVWIDRWSLKRDRNVYQAQLAADGFALTLALTPTQPVMLNGDAGVSQKGPAAQSASYYYSEPHLKVTGQVTRGSVTTAVTGEAWLDHEWSSEYLDAKAVGWDWIGIDLDDGAALMAFRIRGADGGTRWAGGTLRSAAGEVQTLRPDDVSFLPQRRWQSPRTGIVYPVEWRVRAGAHDYELKALMPDQENDTRLSTGAIYWEGAVSAYEDNRLAGHGYLELTGYGKPLALP